MSKLHFIAKYQVPGIYMNASIQDCVDYISDKTLLGLDIETSKNKENIGAYKEEIYKGGLDPYLSNIIMLQIGDLEKQFVIDVRDFTPDELTPLMDFINYNKNVTFVGVNLKFEAKFLKHNYNINLHTIHDCMVVEMCLTNGVKGKYSLAKLAQRYLGVASATESTLFDDSIETTMDDDIVENNDYILTPFELANNEQIDKTTRLQFINIGSKPFTQEQILYGVDDIIYPILIYKKQIQGRVLENKSIYCPTKLFALENKVTLVLADMELNGLPVSKEMWLELAVKAEESWNFRLSELNKYVIQFYPNFTEPPNLFDFEPHCLIDWASSKQVVALFKSLNICPQEYSKQTKRKDYTVGAVALLKVLPNDLKEQYNKGKWTGFEKDEDGLYIENNNLLLLNYLLAKRAEQLATTFGRDWLKYVHPITGRTHSSFRQILNTGRMSSTTPNCISLDTQILTPNGWKSYDEVKVGDNAYTFNVETEKLEVQKIESYYIGESEVIEFNNQHFNAVMTPNHRQLFRDRKNGKYSFHEAKDFLRDSSILNSGVYNADDDGITLSEEFISLLCAIQADGYQRRRKGGKQYKDSSKQELAERYILEFTKQRKTNRMFDILNKLNIPYYYRKRMNADGTFRCDSFVVTGDLGFTDGYIEDKKFTYKLLGLSYKNRQFFLRELMNWDGTYTQANQYTSSEKQNIDVITAIASISNIRCKTLVQQTKYYRLSLTWNKNSSMTANIKEISHGTQGVWCVKVPNNTIICRRGYNSSPWISGNCMQLPKGDYRLPFCVDESKRLIFSDYNSQELRVVADLAKDEAMINFFVHGHPIYGSDLHTYTANLTNRINHPDAPDIPPKGHPDFNEELEVLRNRTKVLEFGIIYGKEAKGFSEDFGTTEEEADKLINDFLGAYPGIKDFMTQKFKETMQSGYIIIDETIDRRWFSDNFAYLEELNTEIRQYYPKEYWGRTLSKAAKELIKEQVYEEYPFVKKKWREYFGILGSIRRKSTNYRVQGTASGQSKLALVFLRQAIIERGYDDCKIVNAIHDEIGIECSAENAEKYKELIEDCMEQGGNYFVQHKFMKATAEIGTYWVH